MAKHTDSDGDGVADYAADVRPADGDDDLGVPHVPGRYFHLLEQKPGLGRHVLHDARSLNYNAADLVEHVTKEVTTFHKRVAPVWDQGQLGACTAFAALGVMMTEPFYRTSFKYSGADAIKFYEQETALDNSQIPGAYPPDDTGSTGLWSMKLLRKMGLISGYKHAFSFTTVKKLLQVDPVSFGVPWYNSMFTPDKYGRIHVDQSSGLAGGHQLDGTGIDFVNQEIELTNSWGPSWGLSGRCRISFADMQALLANHGDCSVPVVS